MISKKFSQYAMNKKHKDYNLAIAREVPLYQRDNDIRSEFGRDYTRVLFSEAYRRLKHKTQVFFAVENDHVCTRNEHVNLVESVSYTIANELGLNTELTKAIAIAHDLGHAPFGHGGETILTQILKKYNMDHFWHERNSLHFVDCIELLEDDNHNFHNLNLTYAIRDGIISHCGEMHQKYIQKREDYISLDEYKHAGQYNPWTYEGCVVKISDKIAYLARDIEDALTLKIITQKQVDQLKDDINKISDYKFNAINNSSIVNYFICDVVEHSHIEQGIGLSDEAFMIMKMIMSFNYKNIYLIDRVKVHNKYVSLILESIFDVLYQCSTQEHLCESLNTYEELYPKLISHYKKWISKYANVEELKKDSHYQNKIVYDFKNHNDIVLCIIDYLAGMSDAFIIQSFNELISF